jgi:TolA-binding protein
MIHYRLLAVVTLLGAMPAFAQKQEIKEVQRDVAILQDDMKELRKGMDELRALLQQALDQSNRNGTSLAKLDAALRDRLKEQEKSVAAPVAGLGTKVDNLSEEVRFTKESVTEINSRMGKLDQRLVDISNAIKVMQAPPAPPSALSAPGGAASSTPSTPPAGVSATSLFKDALHDKSSGNYDLALEELGDYLKWFGDTDDAPLAQFYIGEVYYAKKQYEPALQAFDLSIEKYPRNAKTLDAHFMKGRSLVMLGQRDAGAEEFREIIRTAPSSGMAASARQELKNLGLSAPAPSAASSGAAKKKK